MITLFVVFVLLHGVELVCLDCGATLQYVPPPLWQMLAMFPLPLLGGLFTAGVMFLISGPIEWIVALVLACAVGIPVAEFGKLIWSEESRRS